MNKKIEPKWNHSLWKQSSELAKEEFGPLECKNWEPSLIVYSLYL